MKAANPAAAATPSTMITSSAVKNHSTRQRIATRAGAPLMRRPGVESAGAATPLAADGDHQVEGPPGLRPDDAARVNSVGPLELLHQRLPGRVVIALARRQILIP